MEIVTSNKICRACLVTKESFTYFLLHNVPADLYWFCSSIQVLYNLICLRLILPPDRILGAPTEKIWQETRKVCQDDKLPKALCNTCYELLTKFSHFKRACIHSNETLLSYEKEDKLHLQTEISNEPIFDDEKPILHAVEVKSEVEGLEQINNDFYDDGYSETDQIIQTKRKRSNKKTLKKVCFNIKSKRRKLQLQLSCEHCNKRFSNPDRFEGHKLMHEGKSVSIQCLPCKKTFKTWHALSRHKNNTHSVISLESLKCPICGKVSGSVETLKIHQLAHAESQILICDVCGRGFKSKNILKNHMLTHVENRQKDYECDKCGNKYVSKTALSQHESRRHNERLYICQLCSYPFKDKYTLIRHIYRHEGKKMYSCKVCNKSFSTQSYLIEHNRIHSGERPYECSLCTKKFIAKRMLADHHKIHTGDKPHKCQLCPQAFAQKGTLNRHMRVHDKGAQVVNT